MTCINLIIQFIISGQVGYKINNVERLERGLESQADLNIDAIQCCHVFTAVLRSCMVYLLRQVGSQNYNAIYIHVQYTVKAWTVHS